MNTQSDPQSQTDESTQSAQTQATADQSDQPNQAQTAGEETTTNPATEATVDAADQLQSDLDAMTNTAKRALADLQNYKKRAEEERTSLVSFGAMNMLTKLLPVIDNFERAMNHIDEDIKDHNWTTGMVSIHKQLHDILAKEGLTTFGAANEPFDPERHEGVMQGDGPEHTIVEVFEPGYMMKDKVLRPAKVKVGNGNVE